MDDIDSLALDILEALISLSEARVSRREKVTSRQVEIWAETQGYRRVEALRALGALYRAGYIDAQQVLTTADTPPGQGGEGGETGTRDGNGGLDPRKAPPALKSLVGIRLTDKGYARLSQL
ncbi:MAG: hypothetical protein ACFCBW_12015 [Candidatus Competibacterales bacterium]